MVDSLNILAILMDHGLNKRLTVQQCRRIMTDNTLDKDPDASKSWRPYSIYLVLAFSLLGLGMIMYFRTDRNSTITVGDIIPALTTGLLGSGTLATIIVHHRKSYFDVVRVIGLSLVIFVLGVILTVFLDFTTVNQLYS